MIRPQRKEQKQKAQILASLAVGDSVRTTGGFVGVILDISDDMVIVEFGNNKNCRIPMYKEAIVEVEKPEDAIVSNTESSSSSVLFFRSECMSRVVEHISPQYCASCWA